MTDFVPLNAEEKSKLALEAMTELFNLYLSNRGGLALNPSVKTIMEYWRSKTCKSFDKEEYYRIVEKSIEHLRKPKHSWDE
jgi:hypothetical protein